MGVKKSAGYGGTCKVCNIPYKINEIVCMEKKGETWIICKNEDCFTQQGGTIDAPRQGGKFQSNKIPISEVTRIFNLATELTNSYKSLHQNITPETEAQFMESIFKTVSGNFKL